MRKSLNDHLDQIEKQTVEEMVSAEKKITNGIKKRIGCHGNQKN